MGGGQAQVQETYQKAPCSKAWWREATGAGGGLVWKGELRIILHIVYRTKNIFLIR